MVGGRNALLVAWFWSTLALGGDSTLSLGVYRQPIEPDFQRPPKPIAWQATTKATRAEIVTFNHHIWGSKYFAFLVGGSLGRFQILNQMQTSVTGHWRVRGILPVSSSFRVFGEYSAGNPTLLQHKEIGDLKFGSRFTFEDHLAVGAQIRDFEMSASIPHYSNANLFPPNPGFDVPVIVHFGYRF